MKALVRTLFILLIATCSFATVHAATVAIGAFGYHPSQYKQVVVYTSATSGTYDIYTTGGAKAFTGTLAVPKNDAGNPIVCQGNQPCLVGDFSSFTKSGTYYVQVGTDKSPEFSISSSVFADRAPLFMEYFEALKQQGSTYHKDLHSMETPPFPMMADGSFVMTTDQVAVSGIRLANAYNRDPSLFNFNNYKTTNDNAPDVAEHIKQHVQIMESYQDAAGGSAVAGGYEYDFHCPMDYRPDQEKYTTEKSPCLIWHSETTVTSAVGALHLYAAAIPAINQLDGTAAATALLDRAKRTQAYIKNNYAPRDDDAATYGAALFMLYDYTGDTIYLTEAYNQRMKVNAIMDALNTKGREFYWEEYVRHKSAITSAGLQYEINGKQPETYFKEKIMSDWTGAQNPISQSGERIYILDIGSDFHQSRYMLSEALFAAKAQQLSGNTQTKIVADTHLAWLTGMNSVQDGDWAGPLVSRSFIFGIGSNGKNQHTRLVPFDFFQNGNTFLNGKRFIPGWIGGAKDSWNDEDKTLNYYDDYWSWKYVESTDEIVAEAIELSAYLDAQYNNRAPIARPRLTGAVTPTPLPTPSPAPQLNTTNATNTTHANTTTTNTTNTTNTTTNTTHTPTNTQCVNSVKDMPVNCTGTIVQDTGSSCRTITCAAGENNLSVMACDKDGYFEMYTQQRVGSGVTICLGTTCIGENGYAKSSSFPICTQVQQSPDSTPTTNSTNTTQKPKHHSGGGGGGGGGSSGGSSDTPVSYPLTETPQKVVLYTYSAYTFDADKTYTVRVKEITADAVTLYIGAVPVRLHVGEQASIDLNHDSVADVHIELVKLARDAASFTLSKPTQAVAAIDAHAGNASGNATGNATVTTPVKRTDRAQVSDATSQAHVSESEKVQMGDTDAAPTAGMTAAVTTQNAPVSSRSPYLWVLGAAALITIAGAMIYRSRDGDAAVEEKAPAPFMQEQVVEPVSLGMELPTESAAPADPVTEMAEPASPEADVAPVQSTPPPLDEDILRDITERAERKK